VSPQQVFSVANAVALHGTVLITGASSGIGRMMLEKPEPVLKVNDQDEVARTRRDCEKTLRDLLDEFESVRTDSVTFVKKLKTEDLDCGSIHAKTGHITVRELLHEWVYHDLNHVSQINANFQRFLLNHLGGMQQFYQS
jgi:NADP-dependent 3-hydroxy acid dehydrogenase YdfG